MVLDCTGCKSREQATEVATLAISSVNRYFYCKRAKYASPVLTLFTWPFYIRHRSDAELSSHCPASGPMVAMHLANLDSTLGARIAQ